MRSAIRSLRSRVVRIPMPGKRSWRRKPVRPMCTFRFAAEIPIYVALLECLLPWRRPTKPGPAGERAYDNPCRQELSAAPLSLCGGRHARRGLRRANHASLRIEKNRDNATASQAMRSMTPWIARRTPPSV